MKNKIILTKMIHYIDKIMQYCDTYDYEKFASNDMLVEATVFNLSQIGELTTRLETSFRQDYEHVPAGHLGTEVM